MTYLVSMHPGATREFNRLTQAQRERILPALRALALNPRPPGSAKLAGVNAYRIKVGDCRAVYETADEELLVVVVKVGPRRAVYKDMDTIRRRLER